MIIKKVTLIYLFCLTYVFAGEDINALLQEYRSKAELSQITKIESAGFVDIYTREDLEQMQAHTLLDVLKSLPTLTPTRTSNDLTTFSKTSVHYMPLPAIKLYINDHDVTSASAGSALVIWADMPIEHIDHIEVYKAAASIEFSNEPGTAIVKLYTKQAEREEGGKLRITADQMGSYGLDSYFGHTTLSDISYFFYATKNDIKREKYYNDGYELDSDKNRYNIYANIIYKDWKIDLSKFVKENDDFMGLGRNYTPVDGGIDADQSYIHISKKFNNDFKFQISYDYLDHEKTYKDEGGIYAGDAGFVKSYYAHHKDTIFSVIGEKEYNFNNNKLLLGTFYKYKGFHATGTYDNSTVDYENHQDIYSAYIEDSYHFDEQTVFIASLKWDFYQFDKDIDSKDDYTARLGLIKNVDKFQFKAFATRSYYPIEFYKLYSENSIPFKANSDLKFPEMYIYMASLNYKTKDYEVEFRASTHTLKNNISETSEGYINSTSDVENQFYTLKQTYHFNRNDKIILDLFTGENIKNLEMSPKYGLNLRVFNNFGKFNIYNELIVKSDYEAFGVKLDSSLEYTASIKYLMSSNFSMGVRGENIFDSGYEQAYRNLSESIPVNDQKVWVNMEYLF